MKMNVHTVIEQEQTFDGKFTQGVDNYLLIKIINHHASECLEDAAEMDNPQRFVVRVIIEVSEGRELPDSTKKELAEIRKELGYDD